VTYPQRCALQRLPASTEDPMPRPRRTRLDIMWTVVALGLVEEPSPGLYRRTPEGDALLATQTQENRHAV
jgi:hypothetical protein